MWISFFLVDLEFDVVGSNRIVPSIERMPQVISTFTRLCLVLMYCLYNFEDMLTRLVIHMVPNKLVVSDEIVVGRCWYVNKTRLFSCHHVRSQLVKCHL
jgi:hypothetical protein